MNTSILKRKLQDFPFLLLLLCSIFCMLEANGQHSKVDSLLVELGQLKNDTSKVILYDELSRQLYNTISESGKAIEYAKAGLKLAEEIGYQERTVTLLSKIGVAFINLSEFDSANFYLEKSLAKARQLGDRKGEASAYDNLGIIKIRMGEHNIALNYLRKAIHIYQQEKLPNKIAQANVWFGNVYKDTHQLDSALIYYQKALDYYKIIEDKENVAITLINMSSIFRLSKQYDKAIEWALESIESFKKIGHRNGVGVSLYRLALVYYEMGNLGKAETTLLEGKSVFSELNNEYFLSSVNNMLGMILYDRGEYQQSRLFYEGVLEYCKRTKQPELYATTLFNIGNIHYADNNFDNALKIYLEADSLFKKVHNKKSQLDVLNNLINLYSRTGDYEKVDNCLEKYKELSDSIFNEKVASSVADMQVKYETLEKEKDLLRLKILNEEAENNILLLKKQKEISSLTLQQQISENILAKKDLALKNADNEKQRAQINLMAIQEQQQKEAFENEKRRHSLQHKTYLLIITIILLLTLTFFQLMRNRQNIQRGKLERNALELNRQLIESNIKAIRSQLNPHFIFNCVHTIEVLLNDTQIDQSLICLRKFSSLTRLVLENSQKKEIPLSEEIEILKLYMDLENTRFKTPYSYAITLHGNIDPGTTMVPPLIFQPFIENSIKHGFVDRNKPWKLTVNISKKGESLYAEIVDNGIGRSKKGELSIHSGFKKESMGLKLVEQRLVLMNEMKNTNSSFEIIDLIDDQQKPKGTKVTITLPYDLAI